MVGHMERSGIGYSTTASTYTSATLPSPHAASLAQRLLFLDGELLVANSLVATDAWVQDVKRTHCSVCMQQFLPLRRRRHHCRTCGEVVCGGCSSQRAVRLADANAKCVTRVCTYCVVHAASASVRADEAVDRETCALSRALGESASSSPAYRSTATHSLRGRRHHRRYQPHDLSMAPLTSNHLSLFSIESALTDGSVVQLWPQPELGDDDSGRIKVARHPAICSREDDPTMSLLTNAVARTLECPVAFIGVLDETKLWFKASVGWTRSELPRSDCVATHTLARTTTLVVGDTLQDKHLYMSDLLVNGKPMRFYAGAPICVLGEYIGVVCALDSKAHQSTSKSAALALDSVAKIASEVLEQRVRQTMTADEAHRGTVAPASRLFSLELLAALEEEGVGIGGASSLADAAADAREPPSTCACVGLDEVFCCVEQGEPLATESLRPCWPQPNGASLCPRLRAAAGEAQPHATPHTAPHEYADKISQAMDHFYRLQSQLWSIRPMDPSVRSLLGKCAKRSHCHHSSASSRSSSSECNTIDSAGSFSCSDGSTGVARTFELRQRGRLFTRTNMKVSADCATVVAQLLSYEDARVYRDLLARVQSHNKLDSSTWMDEIAFRPGVLGEEEQALMVLSHCREYPDGSSVIVAVDGSSLGEDSDRSFLLFGWLVAPCRLDDGSQASTVSCIVAQPHETQSAGKNLSLNLAVRVSLSTLGAFELPQSNPLSLGPRAWTLNDPTEESQAISKIALDRHTPETSSTRYSAASITHIKLSAASRQQQQDRSAARLNNSERLMLDLLGRTISTQEALAAQQNQIAGVINLHGAKLQRISTAIKRVEGLLADRSARRGCATTAQH